MYLELKEEKNKKELLLMKISKNKKNILVNQLEYYEGERKIGMVDTLRILGIYESVVWELFKKKLLDRKLNDGRYDFTSQIETIENLIEKAGITNPIFGNLECYAEDLMFSEKLNHEEKTLLKNNIEYILERFNTTQVQSIVEDVESRYRANQ